MCTKMDVFGHVVPFLPQMKSPWETARTLSYSQPHLEHPECTYWVLNKDYIFSQFPFWYIFTVII